ACINCMLVGRLDVIRTGKGGNQHHQRTFGWMEVGQQALYHLEMIAGRDEYAGFTRAALKFAVPGGTFKRAQCSCAYGGDGTAIGSGQMNGIYGFLRNRVNLAMHLMVLDIIGSHWLESTGTDMQRDISHF